jgi:type IV pilus assembly protein PilM
MNLAKWLKPSNIGIDLGSRTVKGVRLQKSGNQVSLVKFLFHDVGMSKTQFPKEKIEGNELKALMEVAGFAKHRVSTSLDDRDVETCEFVLPEMPVEELGAAVRHEAEQRIHFPVEEAFMDHVILERHKEEGQNVLTIKAYVARRERIKQHLNFLKLAELKPHSLETGMLANVAMLDFNGYISDSDNYVVIDLGESKTSVALVMQKKLVFLNSLPIAGGMINRLLAEKKGLAYQDAEKVKIQYAATHESDDPENAAIIDGVLLDLLNGVQHSIDYFKVYTKESPISRILLIGGTSQDPHVASALENICKIETQVPNPFKNIEIFKAGQEQGEQVAKLAPQLATAVGLALRGLDGN